MRCPIETQESAEILLAYTARRLDPDATALLEAHIAVCPACREFAEGQNAVWSALDAWEAVPVSPDFDRRLYQRIERQVSWWELLVRPFRPLLVRQGLPAAAALCVIVTAGLLLEPSNKPAPEHRAAQIEAVQVDQVEDALEDIELLREFHRTVRADAARPL